ncbi:MULTISPECIES: hypothetical protein [unclassified Streptomyces]|uniref:hypothetical protein n=1 Tax=unclassified Streptomyces TaxID=2593676 RepID=UPI0038249410
MPSTNPLLPGRGQAWAELRTGQRGQVDAVVQQLRGDGFEVRDEDVTRLPPFVRRHINMLGRYSSPFPVLPGGLRPLRTPETDGEEQPLTPPRRPRQVPTWRPICQLARMVGR